MPWKRVEDVFARRLEDVLKTSWKRLENVLKTSWRCLEEVLKTFWRRLADVLKTYWRRLDKTSWRCFENVLKTSWRRIEDVWPRQIYWSWPRRLEDVFWRCKTKANIFVLIKMSWRRLEDVFWRRRQKTSSRRLHQDECLLGRFLKRCFIVDACQGSEYSSGSKYSRVLNMLMCYAICYIRFWTKHSIADFW